MRTMRCIIANDKIYKSSAVAEMGDRGHNRHGPKKRGEVCPFRGELGPHPIQCGLGRGLLQYEVASSSIQPFGHIRHGDMGQKLGGNGVPIEHKVAWADAYLCITKWHLDPCSCLATIYVGRKLRGSVTFWGGGLGPHLTQSHLS